MRGNSTISNRCRCHRTAAVDHRTSCRWRPPYAMKTGLTKKQKTTEVYYNAKDSLAEVYTHDTNLKKRLRKYAAKYPELCKQTDDDGQGGLRFEIDKSRISIRLTAPYSDDRRKAASELAKKRGIHTKTN